MTMEPRPLGLPLGSIRALTALTIVAVSVKQILAGEVISLLLAETLLMVLTHYFASRRSHQVPSELHARLVAEGHIPRQGRPLWLPSYSLRLLILVTILGSALYLFLQGRLWSSPSFSLLFLIGAFLLGVLFQRWLAFRARRRKGEGRPFWQRVGIHLLGFVTLAVCLFILAWGLTRDFGTLSAEVQQGLLAFVLFYFGSR